MEQWYTHPHAKDIRVLKGKSSLCVNSHGWKSSNTPFGCKMTWLNLLIPKGQLPNGDRKGCHIVRLVFFNSYSKRMKENHVYCSTWNLSAKILNDSMILIYFQVSSILQYLEVGSVLVRGRSLSVSISKFIFCEKNKRPRLVGEYFRGRLFYSNAVGRTRGGYADLRQDLSSHTCHQLTRQNVPESYWDKFPTS